MDYADIVDLKTDKKRHNVCLSFTQKLIFIRSNSLRKYNVRTDRSFIIFLLHFAQGFELLLENFCDPPRFCLLSREITLATSSKLRNRLNDIIK